LYHIVVEPIGTGWLTLGKLSWIVNYLIWLFISFEIVDDLPPFVRICGWLTSVGIIVQLLQLFLTGDGFLSQMENM